mgnify:CR=1 FL=1|jgi:hypothetical protein
MLKKCKVVMLPTNEKAELSYYGQIALLENGRLHKAVHKSPLYKLQHLYILSNDEIKEGDWCIMLDSLGNVFSNPQQYTDPKTQHLNKRLRKIIATTDESLKLNKPLFAEKNKEPEWLILPQPSQSFIEKYVEEYNKDNVIIDVMVEYELNEELAIVQIQEGIDRVPTAYILKINPKNNTIIIKKVKDSWNKEEIIDLIQSKINDYQKEGASYGILFNLRDWIKENL